MAFSFFDFCGVDFQISPTTPCNFFQSGSVYEVKLGLRLD